MKIKEKFPKVKECIKEILKYSLFIIVMSIGFWMILYFGWIALGLPQNNTALWLTFVHALIYERLFIKWLSK